MIKQTLFFALSTIFLSCKKEPVTNTKLTTGASKCAQSKNECYSYNAKGSTIQMQIQFNTNQQVFGTLEYALAEKDQNSGTFTGKIQNEMLIAEYKYQSEGTVSSRQIAFKISGDKILAGYGEMTSDGTHFKDTNTIKFDTTMPLKLVACAK